MVDPSAMPPNAMPPNAMPPNAGLCARCVHVIVRPTRRGTVYLRCGLAVHDDRFPRYPPLPVRACPGFRPAEPVTDDPPQR